MIAARSVMPASTKVKLKLDPHKHGWGSSACVFEIAGSTNATQKPTALTTNATQKPTALTGSKRGPLDALEGQSEKRLKMDRTMTRHCTAILKALMMHQFAWAFRYPVDPVKLNIPDYFLVITKPMDLGTVKSKLEKFMYAGTDEFAADVRLTFSNAMLYNPPTNDFHIMARKLNDIFEAKWRSLVGKLNHERSKASNAVVSSENNKDSWEPIKNSAKTSPLDNAIIKRRPEPFEKKPIKTSLIGNKKDKLTKPAENCEHKPAQPDFLKGKNNGASGHSEDSPTAKRLLGSVACKCSKCGRSACECSHPSYSTQTSSDLSSERSSGRYPPVCTSDAHKLTKSKNASQKITSDLDSDAVVSTLENEGTHRCSQLTSATPMNVASGQELLDEQMSPNRALRAAKLKQRFAGIILKSRKETLLHGDEIDPVKILQEKERLERMQLEERARIEAQIKAAEAASRLMEEMELKRRREREREAARAALEKMEKAIQFYDKDRLLKDLEMLCGPSISYTLYVGCEDNYLEKFGLFRKEENVDEDIMLNAEEGEILC